MAKYLFIYTSGDEPRPDTDMDAITQAWIGWFTGLGDAVVDPGNPVGASGAIAPNGAAAAVTADVGGYSVIRADSLEAALEIAKSSPALAANGSVEVFETVEVM